MKNKSHRSGKSYHRTGGWNDHTEALHRVFGSLEVVDSTADLIVTVDPEDSIGAVRTNAENCVFSKACHRLFHSSKAVFFRSIVYVDLPNDDGERKIYRFKAGTRMYNAIAGYDLKGTFAPGTYTLSAPSASQTLNGLRQRSKKDYEKSKKTGKAKQYYKKVKARKASIKSKATKVKTIALAGQAEGFFRSGTGLISTKVVQNNAQQ